MKVLVIGSEQKAAAVESQLVMVGHSVGYAVDVSAAAILLRRNQFDIILLIDCERLEEGDLVAEELKMAALANHLATTPYVFVIWNTVVGFEPAREYGLQAIDILMEDFQAKRCWKAYEYAMRNQI